MASCSDQSEQKCCRIQRATCNNQQHKFHLQRNKKVTTRLQHKISAKKKTANILLPNDMQGGVSTHSGSKKGQTNVCFITFPTKRSGGEFTTLANPQTATKRRAIVTSVDLAPRFVRLVKVFDKIPGFWGTTEFNRIYLLYIEIHISGIFGRIFFDHQHVVEKTPRGDGCFLFQK